MLNFARFFFQGLKNTLRLQNGVNFSYKGPWVPVIGETVIDEWYVGDFMAAEYTVVVDVNNGNKEVIKALVVAGPEVASLTVFGRTNTNTNLLELSATVNSSKVSVIASPAFSVDGSTQDNSSLLQGGKLIYSANYYHTQNDLTPF
jgi:hypothetical protein